MTDARQQQYARRTSALAVASLVLSILWVVGIGSLLAVLFGHWALADTRDDPAVQGRGMAVAGLVIGYVSLGFTALIMVAYAVGGAS